MWQNNADDYVKAQSFFEQAIERDPLYADAWGSLAFANSRAVMEQWTTSPAHSIGEVQRAARKCVSLDPQSPLGQYVLAFSYYYSGRLEEAVRAAERAIELRPSWSGAYNFLGTMLAFTGRPDEGIAKIETGMRLDPKNPMMWFTFQQLAAIHLTAERFEEAADAARRSIQRNPDTHNPHALLAISYAHLGRIDEAGSEFQEVLRLQPDYSLAGVKQVFAGANREFVELVIEGLRKAGLEE